MGKEVIVVIIQALFLGFALGYLMGKKAALAIAHRILEEYGIKAIEEDVSND